MTIESIATVHEPVDTETFLDVMATLASGVAIATTLGGDGRPYGLTTTAVTSVSLDPPLLLICVGRTSRTLSALRHSGGFVLNFVDSDFAHVAAHFASKVEDKFAELVWRAGATGHPILHEHSLAWAECLIEQEIDAGDHVVLIASVHGAESNGHDRLPLTYFRRRFGSWSEAAT